MPTKKKILKDVPVQEMPAQRPRCSNIYLLIVLLVATISIGIAYCSHIVNNQPEYDYNK